MKKRKLAEEGDDEVGEQQVLPPTEPLKTKSPSKKGKSKSGRALQKAAGHISHEWKHCNNKPKIPWSCTFSVEGRPIDEDDWVVKGNEVRGGQVANAIRKALLLPRDMKIWQGDSSESMIENLKRDSVLVVFKHFFGNLLYPNALLSLFSFNFECVFRPFKGFLGVAPSC